MTRQTLRDFLEKVARLLSDCKILEREPLPSFIVGQLELRLQEAERVLRAFLDAEPASKVNYFDTYWEDFRNDMEDALNHG